MSTDIMTSPHSQVGHIIINVAVSYNISGFCSDLNPIDVAHLYIAMALKLG